MQTVILIALLIAIKFAMFIAMDSWPKVHMLYMYWV